MIEPVVAFFEKLIDQFTWRRFVFLTVLCTLAGSGVWAYETYTQSFKLARIERQIDLLDKFAAVKAKTASSGSPELKLIEASIQTQLLETTRTSSTEYVLLPWAKKMLAAALAWFGFGIFVSLIPNSYTKAEPATGSVLAGITVFATPFVAISVILPTNPWINYVIYPVGHILLVFIGLNWFFRFLQRVFVRRALAQSNV